MIIVLSSIFIYLLGAYSTKAQEIEIADSLVVVENFDLATVYYEKAIFSAKEPEKFNSILFKLSSLHKQRELFEEYAKTLERINKSVLSKPLRVRLFYELTFAYFMLEEYSKAQFNWLQLESINEQLSKDALLLKTLLFAKLRKWDESREAFLAYSKDSSDNSLDVFEEIKSMKLKSPEKAENLSYFLPGVGQMYAGKPLRGLTSLTLQSGMLAFAAFNFFNGYYISGTFTGVSLFYVFYMGGARHASYLAEEFNKRQHEKAYRKLTQLIVETKKGQ